MSVRAYKILEVAKGDSFNLWHMSGKLWDAIEANSRVSGDEDSCYISINEGGLKLIEQKCRGKVADDELDTFIATVKQDFGKEDYAEYLCY